MAKQIHSMRRQRKPIWIILRHVFTYLLLTIGTLIAIFPFFWMISTSLMTLGDAMGTHIIPPEIHFENYVDAWNEADFSLYIWNSTRITLLTLAGELTFSTLAAYAFARIKFPGRDLIFTMLLATMMIPAMVTIIPNFLTVTWLGRIGPLKWINNWPALTIPFMGSVFSIFLLRQFFAQIPDELYDAIQMDGGGHLRFLWSVVLPLSKAPMLVIIVLSFIGTWNSLAWPMLSRIPPIGARSRSAYTASSVRQGRKPT
jgi:ABC-type glycerol-3-phosphate transport system permease component